MCIRTRFRHRLSYSSTCFARAIFLIHDRRQRVSSYKFTSCTVGFTFNLVRSLMDVGSQVIYFWGKFTRNRLQKNAHDGPLAQWTHGTSSRQFAKTRSSVWEKNNVHMVNCSRKNKTHVFILSSWPISRGFIVECDIAQQSYPSRDEEMSRDLWRHRRDGIVQIVSPFKIG